MALIGSASSIHEIVQVEGDDNHHDFGGPHANKGNDFAHFWLIVRALEIEKSGQSDYAFLCEYCQDIAEFDSSASPSSVVLYQLKKKEDGYWSFTDLTGQSKRDKNPKPHKPIPKLFRSVTAFKSVAARGEFVSNAKFNVSLASAESSVNSDKLALSDLDSNHTNALVVGFGKQEGISPTDVDLTKIILSRVTLHVDDLQRHTNGVMLEYLQTKAPEHANQASSLVDTLYVRVKATARRTDKCKSWDELIERRGFRKTDFNKAVESLSSIPDKAASRNRLFDRLAKNWTTRVSERVLNALTTCAREKVLVGTSNRWNIDKEPVHAACEFAESTGQSDHQCFEAVVSLLAHQIPHASSDEINALAIYEMTEWNLNQTPA